ncbi:MAG: response regulator transcription factor [Alistipes sp.]|nr:response regulator transcription factor [Alistipes sp.]
MRRCRVAIVESSAIVVEGLRAMLAQSADFEVVFAADSLDVLIARFGVVAPDMVIVGSQCYAPAAMRAEYDELKSVALVGLMTTVREESYVRQFDGVVNLYDAPQQLLQNLRRAVEQNETNPYDDSHDLSEREQDVLVLVANGLSNKEIADRLNISPHTVISHRKNIVHKTGIKSVAGLTVYAMLNNLISVE